MSASTALEAAGTVSHTLTVYAELRRRILDNAIAAGSSVSIKELADEFGVSRTPIRDALIRLEKEGLLEFVPHQGVRILPLSADDMGEIYMILAGLELAAIETILDRAPDETALAPMDAGIAAMEAALAEDDLNAWATADEAFHDALVKLAGNRRLADLVAGYRSQTRRARLITLRLRPKPTRSTKHHRALTEAIRAGDRAAARSLHLAQRSRSAGELTEILAKLNLRHL